MNFPCTTSDIPPAYLVLSRHNTDNSTSAQTISTVDTYKYLGVIIDPKLRWAGHHQRVVANATWWSHQVSRLSKVSGGMPPKRMRQLYNTVAVPAFTYAADVWYTGVHSSPTGLKRLGSIAITKKLSSVQRHITKAITGALSTAAGDVMEAHANLLPVDLLPVDLLFSKILVRAATQMASLPLSHPIHVLCRKVARCYVKKHRSPLHSLFHIANIVPDSIEPHSSSPAPP
jgi:hypothetical protein